MTKKKVYVKPHERRGETGTTEHVRGHTRNQEVKNKGVLTREIPEDGEESQRNDKTENKK
jgi:hypothetical protein